MDELNYKSGYLALFKAVTDALDVLKTATIDSADILYIKALLQAGQSAAEEACTDEPN